MKQENIVVIGPVPAVQEVVFADFSVEKPLAECRESMLIDSDTVIAFIRATTADGLTAEVQLMVRGSVSVRYNGQVYHKPSEFPQELCKWILEHYTGIMEDPADMSDEQLDAAMEAFDPDDYDDSDTYVTLNNWFEYIYEVTDEDGDTVHNDGILCEDELHTMTEEQLRSEMEEVARQVLELAKGG